MTYKPFSNGVTRASVETNAIKNITQFLFGCHGLTYDTKFGFINKVDLVGIGECNNPFFVDASGVVDSKVRGNDDSNRSNFLNHRFVSSNSNIFDSCAGPALGTNTLAEYISSVVDISTPDNPFKLNRPDMTAAHCGKLPPTSGISDLRTRKLSWAAGRWNGCWVKWRPPRRSRIPGRRLKPSFPDFGPAASRTTCRHAGNPS